jgi:hypothetical protein
MSCLRRSMHRIYISQPRNAIRKACGRILDAIFIDQFRYSLLQRSLQYLRSIGGAWGLRKHRDMSGRCVSGVAPLSCKYHPSASIFIYLTCAAT